MNSRQLAHRIGGIDDRLVQQAGELSVLGGERKSRRLRRVAAAAVAAALMAASFITGALAFSTEKIVEVPAQQEIIELEDVGITLLLPDDWKGQYELMVEEGPHAATYAVVCPEIREAFQRQTRQEWAERGMEWDEEYESSASMGGLMFMVVAISEVMTKEEYDNSGWVWGDVHRYLFATDSRTYVLYYASDLQCTQDTMEHYDALMASLEKELRILVNGVLS